MKLEFSSFKLNINYLNSVLIMLFLNFGTIYSISIGTKKFNFSYSEIFLYIFLLVFLFTNKFKINFKINNYIFLKSIFIIYIISVNFWAESLSANLSVNYYFIVGLISYVFFLNIYIKSFNAYSKGLRTFGLVFSVLIIIVFLYNIIFIYDLFDVRFYQLKKTIGTPLGNSNYLALFLNFMIFFEIITQKKHWKKYSFLYLIALFLTLSRGGYIAFLFGIFLLILLNMIFMKNYKFSFIFIFTFIMSLFFLLYLSNNFLNLTNYSTVFTRFNIWQDHINLFIRNPIWGSGYQYENITNSHNIILTILSSYGVVGFSLSFFYFGNLILLSLKYFLKNMNYSSLKFLIPLSVLFVHTLVEPFFLNAESQIFISAFYANLHKEIIFSKRK